MKLNPVSHCSLIILLFCQVLFSQFNLPHRHQTTGNDIRQDTTLPKAVLLVKIVDSTQMPLMNKCYLYINSAVNTTYKVFRDYGSKDTVMSLGLVPTGIYSLQLNVDRFPPQYFHPNGNTVFPVFKLSLPPDTTFLRVIVTMRPIQNPDTTQKKAVFLVRLIDSTSITIMNKCTLYLNSTMNNYTIFREYGTKDSTLSFALIQPGMYSLRLNVDQFPPQFYNPAVNTVNDVFRISIPPDTTRFMIRMTRRPVQNVDTTTKKAVFLVRLLDSANTPLMNKCNLYLSSTLNSYPLFRDYGTKDTTMAFVQIPPGQYSLRLNVDMYPPQFFNPAGNTLTESFKISIPPDTTFQKVMVTKRPVQTGVATISGYVNSDAVAPLANIKVCAIDTANLQWLEMFNVNNFAAEYTARTDATGKYALYNMRPGRYILLAVADSGNYMACFYPNVFLPALAERIFIDNSTVTKTANFSLKRGAEVIGFVKNETGNGIQDIRINLWRYFQNNVTTQTSKFYYELRSDSNGKFNFRGIPNGSWYAEANDDRSWHFRIDRDYEEIKTIETSTFMMQKNIIMRAGGLLAGTYTSPVIDSTNQMSNLGRVYIYPSNLTNFDSADLEKEIWSYMYIGINSEPNRYFKTSPIPEGNWIMVVSPVIPYDKINNSVTVNPPFFPCLRWMFIDNALTLESTNPVTITPKQKVPYNLSFQSGGYGLIGSIKGDSGELFGKNSITGVQGKNFYIQMYIRESRGFVRIGESYQLQDNKFAVSGLIDGQQYYFRAWAENYRDQWWLSIPDSTTCIKKNAQPYTFSTFSFRPLVIYLKAKPEGWNQNINVGPAPVKNLIIRPVALTSFFCKWSASPPQENVARYKIYRLKKASENWFKKDEMGYWHPVDDSLKLGSLDSFYVRDTFFIDTSAAADIRYMYVPSPIDAQGHEGTVLPQNSALTPYFSTISLNSFSSSTLLKENTWQMAGLCGLDSQVIQSTTQDIKMFHWDETFDSSKLYSHYKTITTLQPKQGAWIYSAIPVSFTLTEEAFRVLDNNKNSITLSLCRGWNQVASPFPYSVTPRTVSPDFTAFEWISDQNSYRLSKVLRPWQGYWIYSTDAAVMTLSPLPALVNLLNDTFFTRQNGWQVQVSLIGSASSDPDNFIGVLPQECSRSFSTTTPEPPQAFDFPQLYMLKDQELLSRYYHVSSPVPENNLEWPVGISPAKEKMDVVIQGIATLPEEVHLFFLCQGNLVDLRKSNSITIQPHNQTVYASIIATTRPEEMVLLNNTVLLKQNFPNPFRRTTSIEFVVPYQLNADGSVTDNKPRISLSIYTLSGKLVATVFSGPIKPGKNRKTWDGKSNTGRLLPGGIYIAQLKCGHLTKSIKLCKIN